jgi:Photosynthesis system II assembly factor YCF48
MHRNRQVSDTMRGCRWSHPARYRGAAVVPGRAALPALTVLAAAGSAGVLALQAVQFTDAAHGWVAGDGRILATSDGGQSWTRQYSGSGELDQVDFTDAAHGWAVGPGTLLRTANGGASWTALREPRLGGHCLAVASVHFVSPAAGYAVAAPQAAGAGSAPASAPGPPSTRSASAAPSRP